MPEFRKSGTWDFGQVIIGVLIGIAIALPFFLFSTEEVAAFIKENALRIIVFGSFLTAFLLLILSLRRSITKWLLGTTLKSAEDVTEQALSLTKAVTDGDFETVQRESKDLALQLAAIYGWVTARRAIISIILVFSGLLAGVMGSALLIQQNKILQSQNRNLDLQLKTSLLSPILQEANRRVPLYSQITSLFARIDEEVAAQTERLQRAEDLDPETTAEDSWTFFTPVRLSDRLYSDIIGLSLQLKPYLHFDSRRLDLEGISEVADAPEKVFENLVFLSPERGMLLRYLIENGVKLDEGVLNGADFTYSDLRGFRIESPFFDDFDVQQKISFSERFICRYGDLAFAGKSLEIGISLENSDLSGAFLSGLSFDPTNVKLDGASIRHSVLGGLAAFDLPYILAAENASFYDVLLSTDIHSKVQLQLKKVIWRAFHPSCLDLQDETDLQLQAVELYPIEVYSDGGWNTAVEFVSEAVDTEDYSRWLPPELVESLI